MTVRLRSSADESVTSRDGIGHTTRELPLPSLLSKRYKAIRPVHLQRWAGSAMAIHDPVSARAVALSYYGVLSTRHRVYAHPFGRYTKSLAFTGYGFVISLSGSHVSTSCGDTRQTQAISGPGASRSSAVRSAFRLRVSPSLALKAGQRSGSPMKPANTAKPIIIHAT